MSAPEHGPRRPTTKVVRPEVGYGVDEARVSLRVLDWRFLLPLPAEAPLRHLVLLGAPEAHAHAALEAGVAERVSRELRPDADAVVVVRRAGVSFRDAAECLVPGGVLYGEVDRRRPGHRTLTPARLARSLRAAGAQTVCTYAVTPSFERPHMYLPLEEAGPLRWFLSTLFLGDTPAKRALGRALDGLLRRGGQLGLRVVRAVVPSYSVVAVAGGPGGVSYSPSVLGAPEAPPALRAPGLRPLVLAWGQNESNRVALLPFERGSCRPRLVVKASRRPEYGAWTADDQATLAALYPLLEGPLQGTLPEPFGTFEWRGTSVGVEACVPGRLFQCVVGEWGTPFSAQAGAFRRAAAWLTEFHRTVQFGRLPWTAAEVERRVDEPLAAYEAALGTTPAEAALFEATRARGRALIGQSVPLVRQHGSYSGINVFVDETSAYVIDWESSAQGLPVFDLLYCAVEWSHAAQRLSEPAERLRDFRALFFGPAGPHARAVTEAVQAYVAALAVDPGFVPLMHVLLHVARSLGYIDAAGRQPGARAENPYVGYIRVLGEHAGTLFAEAACP